MKKNAGFTLIELIVVIAILAILAGIAIPVYSGYIEKAKEAADLQVLDARISRATFLRSRSVRFRYHLLCDPRHKRYLRSGAQRP